jgi:hypothetical protein
MNRILLALVAASSVFVPAPARAAEPPQRVYLIGNSLTWDTVPAKLDGDVQWHVDCGKGLPYIYEHPEEPCVKTSTLWPTALKEKQYDIVSIQVHYGSTLADDVATIAKWLALQPEAVCVIHTGWAHHENRAAEYTTTDLTGPMVHSPAYVAAVIAELQKQFPDREFRQTHAIELINRIATDVAAGKGPFNEVAELHRDKIHMKLDTGRYLMHNAMRRALGQPPSAAGWEMLDPAMKQYLDGILATLDAE